MAGRAETKKSASFRFIRCLGLSAIVVCSVAARAPALEIEFDYRFDGTGFFDAPERRAALEAAASLYSGELVDTLAPIDATHWQAVFPHPATGETVEIEAPEIREDHLIVFVGARPMRGGGALAVAGPGYWRFSCFSFFPKVGCIAEALEARNVFWAHEIWPRTFPILFRSSEAARSYPPTDFAPWGGHISFAADARWYFGLEGPVPADRYDFLTAAAHELGHILGVGTAESWATQTNGLHFVGDHAVTAFGGSVSLEDDFAHFAPGTLGHRNGVPAEALFNRHQARGERRWPTDLDFAALRDVGWRRDVPPAPGTSTADPYAGRRMKGDLDGDGEVDSRDVDILAGTLLHAAHAREWDLAQGDVWRRQGGFGADGIVDTHEAGQDLDLLEVTIEIVEQIERSGDCTWQPRPAFEFEKRAAQLLGLTAHVEPGQGCRYSVRPIAGDADGDGDVDRQDYLFFVGGAWERVDVQGWLADAGDVWPFDEGGNANGDGRLDERDLDALAGALAGPDGDADGDDLLDEDENGLNRFAWMTFVGRPQHSPLTRWTGACLSNHKQLLEHGVIAYLGRTMEILFEFCSRGGTPWSLALEVPPEEVAGIALPPASARSGAAAPVATPSTAAPPGVALPPQSAPPGEAGSDGTRGGGIAPAGARPESAPVSAPAESLGYRAVPPDRSLVARGDAPLPALVPERAGGVEAPAEPGSRSDPAAPAVSSAADDPEPLRPLARLLEAVRSAIAQLFDGIRAILDRFVSS